MKIINNPDGINYGDTLMHINQYADYDGLINIRYRGNSSYTESEKKPYSIKTVKDSIGIKQKVSLLGMGKDDDWCLLAPWSDRSLIRAPLTYTLAEGYFEFVPKIKLCELIVNRIYYGVYHLSERIRRGKHRLDIKKTGDEGDELTGDLRRDTSEKRAKRSYIS